MKFAAYAYGNAIDIYSIESGELITSLENMKILECFLLIMNIW